MDDLSDRLPAIRSAVLSSVYGVMPDAMVRDSDYARGLQLTADALIDYSVQHVAGGVPLGSLPAEATAQVRRAVQHGVAIEVVMMRCIAAHSRLNDFVLETLGETSDIRQRQDAYLRWLTASMASEYRREQSRQTSREDARMTTVQALLAGGRSENASLDYRFDAWHIGVVAGGDQGDIATVLNAISTNCGCQLLSVPCGAETVWAWFGYRRRSQLESKSHSISLAVGEPAFGIDGWRLTHHEAQAARQVAMNGRAGTVYCTNVLLDAAVLRDETISAALMRDFLAPLDALQISGVVARKTLATYLNCQLNVAKTAAVLKVNRKTVESRLREVKGALGRPLPTCLAELEVALRLESTKA